MAQKPPDGLPWGRLPSRGPNGPLREGGREREREKDPAHRSGSFISWDKEKETTRPAWTISSLPDTYADIHTHHSITQTLRNSHGENKNNTFMSVFSLSETESQRLIDVICALCRIKRLERSLENKSISSKICSRTSDEWQYCDRYMIYRFNDSYLYQIPLNKSLAFSDWAHVPSSTERYANGKHSTHPTQTQERCITHTQEAALLISSQSRRNSTVHRAGLPSTH